MGSSTIVTQANVVAVSHVLRIGGTNTVIAEAGMLAFNSGNFWVCRTNGTWEIIF
jgi:hypothetical protein